MADLEIYVILPTHIDVSISITDWFRLKILLREATRIALSDVAPDQAFPVHRLTRDEPWPQDKLQIYGRAQTSSIRAGHEERWRYHLLRKLRAIGPRTSLAQTLINTHWEVECVFIEGDFIEGSFQPPDLSEKISGG